MRISDWSADVCSSDLTRAERVEALVAIRDIQKRHGHIQEVIIQNFRAKPDTLMADHPEPSLDEPLWTIADARLILGPEMPIQAPPNLQPDALAPLLRAVLGRARCGGRGGQYVRITGVAGARKK